jgi:hypothetical protein
MGNSMMWLIVGIAAIAIMYSDNPIKRMIMSNVPDLTKSRYARSYGTFEDYYG